MTESFDHTLDLPFDGQAPGALTPEDLDRIQVAGGVVVMGATVPVPVTDSDGRLVGDGEVKPALVFRFVRPDGTFHDPVLLVNDPSQIRKTGVLVTDAARAALAAAHAENHQQ